MDDSERAALDRLIKMAERDSGGSRRVADFLLSWSSPATCGKFDPTDTWYLDQAVRDDILRVLALLMRAQVYPDSLGYGEAFRRIQLLWRDTSTCESDHLLPMVGAAINSGARG